MADQPTITQTNTKVSPGSFEEPQHDAAKKSSKSIGGPQVWKPKTTKPVVGDSASPIGQVSEPITTSQVKEKEDKRKSAQARKKKRNRKKNSQSSAKPTEVVGPTPGPTGPPRGGPPGPPRGGPPGPGPNGPGPGTPPQGVPVPPPQGGNLLPPTTYEKMKKKLTGFFVPNIQQTPWKADNKMKSIEDQILLMRNFYPAETARDEAEFWKSWVLLCVREKPVEAFDEETIQLALLANVNYRVTNKINAFTHPRVRVCRSIIDRLVLGQAIERATLNSSIVDYFGSARLLDLWEAVTKAANKILQPTLNFAWYRPILTTKDAVDYTHRLLKDVSQLPVAGDTVILYDIYESPESLLRTLYDYGVENIIIATQIFTETSIAGLKFETSPYYQHNGLIYQAPSIEDHIWTPTPPNEFWITHSGYCLGTDSYAWDTYRKFDDYYVLRCVLHPGAINLMEMPLNSDPGSVLEYRNIEKPPTWWSDLTYLKERALDYLLFRESMYERPLLVFMPAVRSLEGSMVNKTRQTFQFSNLQKEVLDLVNNNDYQQFWLFCHGFNKSKIVADTVTWLSWKSFNYDYVLLKDISQSWGGKLQEFRTLKNTMAPSPLSVIARLVLYAWGGLITFQLMRGSGLLTGIMIAGKLLKNTMLTGIIPLEANIGTAMQWFFTTYLELVKRHTNLIKVPMYCLTALVPVFEECFKSLSKHLPFLFGLLEGSLQAASAPLPIFGKIAFALLKACLHDAFSYSTQPVLTHSLWNCATYLLQGSHLLGFMTLASGLLFRNVVPNNPAPMLPWGKFKIMRRLLPCNILLRGNFELQNFKEDHKKTRSHLKEYTQPISCTEEEAELPATIDAPIYPDCPISRDAVLEAGPKASMFILLATTALFYRPAGPLQFWHAYKQRNLMDVPITEICERKANPPLPHQTSGWKKCVMGLGNFTKIDDCPMGIRWAQTARFFRKLLHKHQFDLIPVNSEEWIKHFNGAAKKLRAKEGIGRRNEGEILYKSGLFLKSDEVLFGREGLLKGRVIQSLDPTIQAVCYKQVDLAMQTLKHIFTERHPFKWYGWSLTFAIGSGRTGDQLDQWFQISFDWVTLLPKRAACIFAGDDFFAIVNDEGNVKYYENDFSSMDRTQGAHALEAELSILKTLGVSKRVLKTLHEAYLITPRYESTRFQFKVRMPMPIQRVTGGPTTTIGNTLTNLQSIIYSLTKGDFTQIAENQLKLGLKAKLSIHLEATHGTFLKGWWVPTTVSSYQWLPLPSQVIKLGKILTSPKLIYKNLDVASAWKAAAAAMAASYGTIPFEYPIFGKFLERYSSLSQLYLTDEEFSAFEDRRYKVYREEALPIDRTAAEEMIMFRYQLTVQDIREMELEVVTSSFPGVMIHSGWRKLAQKDYG